MGYVRIKLRGSTLSEWELRDPIIDRQEIVVEYPQLGVGTGFSKFKIGDGIHKYTELPYAFDADSATNIIGGDVYSYNLISLRAGSTLQWVDDDEVLRENELVYDTTTNSLKVGDGTTPYSELKYIATGKILGFANRDFDFGTDNFGDLPVHKLSPRRGTESVLNHLNPVLEFGEIIIEHPDEGFVTGQVRVKVGDGTTHYKDLPYAIDVVDTIIYYEDDEEDDKDNLLTKIKTKTKLSSLIASIKAMLVNLNSRTNKLEAFDYDFGEEVEDSTGS